MFGDLAVEKRNGMGHVTHGIHEAALTLAYNSIVLARSVYRRIARASPASRLVVFTSYLLGAEERSFVQAGAAKCLLKGISLKALAEELRSVVQETPAGAHGSGAPRAV